MNNWPYRPLSDFLIEREGRFKPNDPKIASYKRLDKIDFSGKIHISEKPSKTDMIIIEPGDLVISGINVAKGALAVYDGDEPLTATIHYSSYRFNKNKIDIEFLKRFLKSPAFISELQDQVKGGIKTEIKPKHLLPLKARIPELAEQQKINHYFDAVDNEISDLSNEVNTQSSYLTKLRQAILQEAIEGKLTVDWRKENPVRKGDPDYDAEALLEKIQAEKEKLIKEGKIKKQKPLAPIKAEEVTFELPEGWVWTRLGEVCHIEKGSLGITKAIPGEYPLVALSEERLSHNEYQFNCSAVIIPLISSTGHGHASMKRIHYQEGKFSVGNILCCVYPKFDSVLNMKFLYIYLDMFKEKFFVKKMKGAANVSLNISAISETPIPLIPIHIQNNYEKIVKIIDELEKQVSERKELSKQLMQAVLREAFERGK